MKYRAPLLALVVVLVLCAVGFYAARRIGMETAASEIAVPVAQDGGLYGLFGDGPNDDRLIGIALAQLEQDYYKPIAPQTPFRGVSSGLRAYLKTKHIVAKLPQEHATGDLAVDANDLENEVAYAQSHYGAAAGNTDLLQAALRGMMGSVDDPYTVYLSPREIQQLTEMLAGGDFGGVGVYILPTRTGEIVIAPIPNLPAARAGITEPMVLVSVDGKLTRHLTPDDVQTLIRGRTGTRVTIRAYPLGKPKASRAFGIVREIIHVPTVSSTMEKRIDYIRLSEFGDTSAHEMRAALLNGKAHGAKGYIIDLRYNGGGLVDAAVDIVSFFVPKGAPIVSEVDRTGHALTSVGTGATIPGLQPLVILVNGSTASASEITAGALQDYHLATLVGTQTFGKGVVQTIRALPGNAGALKITVASYVTPKGRNIEHRGIRPNIIVPDPDPRLIGTARDTQLQAAKARIAQLLRATHRLRNH
ncbi:MAG: S41 family peptidase [Candidatus Tyrphobacter sp.]